MTIDCDNLDGPIAFAAFYDEKATFFDEKGHARYPIGTMLIYEQFSGWHFNVVVGPETSVRLWLDPKPSKLPTNWFIA